MNKRVFKNTSWMIIQQIFSMIVSLVIGALSARYLGPSNYGLITYGTSLITICSSFAKLGLDSIVINRIVLCKSKEEEDKQIGSAFFLRILSALISFIAINLFVFLFNDKEPILITIVLIQSISLFLNVFEILSCYFTAKLQYKYLAICLMVSAAIAGIYKLFLTVFNYDLVWFAFVAVIQSFVSLLLISSIYIIKFRGKFRISLHESKNLLKSSYHLMLSAIAVTIYTQIDRIMIKNMIDNESVGVYSAAVTLAMLWEFVPQAIINSYSSVLYSTVSEDEKFKVNVSKISAIIICLGCLVTVGYFVLGGVVLKFVYGEQYSAGSVPMKIVAVSTCFAMLSTLRGVWMIAKKCYKYDKYCVLIGAATNLVLNLVFIPRFGIVGAAITTLVAQIVNGIIATLLFPKTRPFIKSVLMFPKGLKLLLKRGEKNDEL